MSSDDGTTLRREPTSIRAPEQSLLLYHREGAKIVPLPAGAAVVVGRTWPSDSVVDDPSLSRQHARFTSTGDGVLVEDLESTNGTWVNGARVEKARVALGDVIRLGDVTACLHVVSSRTIAGIESHDRFQIVLADEVRRALTFTRPLSLLMVRADPGPRSGLSHWTPRLTSALRPVDHVGMYAPDTVTISLPELGRAEAHAVAARLLEDGGEVRVGVAVFPEDGASVEELLACVRASLQRGTLDRRVADRAASASPPPNMIVQNARMLAVLDDVARVASSNLPVLIHGETGTGKELIARALHDGSARRGGPLKAINCGAIPATLVEGMLFGHERGAFTSADRTTKGIFEQATGGTVFLDEIGELSAAAQAALLRVLESKKVTRVGGVRELDVDVRVVAATHRDLEAMCDAGQFRRDLLYRLNAVTLMLPPLRERREEIEPLVRAFIAECNRESQKNVRAVDPAVWERFARYGWPGNVRELKNVVERAVVIARGDVLVADDLPERIRGTTEAPPAAVPAGALDGNVDFKDRIRLQTQRYETDLIVEALRRTGGNQTEAAKLLAMPVRTLAHKMKELGIKRKFE